MILAQFNAQHAVGEGKHVFEVEVVGVVWQEGDRNRGVSKRWRGCRFL